MSQLPQAFTGIKKRLLESEEILRSIAGKRIQQVTYASDGIGSGEHDTSLPDHIIILLEGGVSVTIDVATATGCPGIPLVSNGRPPHEEDV